MFQTSGFSYPSTVSCASALTTQDAEPKEALAPSEDPAAHNIFECL